MPRSDITTTNYGLLGLLAVRPVWPVYELVHQSRRVLGLLWPRAESKVYASAKRLVELGLATVEESSIGRRRRTLYSITPEGRRALQEWLRQPGGGPAIEFDGAIKLFFADQSDKQAALATIDAVLEWAAEMRATGAAIGQEVVDSGGGRYPERLHINTLINRFLLDHNAMVENWARWTRAQIEDWDGTGPQPHRREADLESFRRAAASVG